MKTPRPIPDNNPPEPSYSGLAGCAGFFVGAIAGALGGFFLPELFYRITAPQVLQDG
jgi:nitrate/nitrite transporter NarK